MAEIAKEDMGSSSEPTVKNTVEDLESDFEIGTTVATSSVHVRLGFLRKVYGLLAFQLTLTVVISTLFMVVTPLRNFAVKNEWIAIVSIILSLGCLFGLLAARHRYPLNLYLLAVFTVLQSLSVGNICAIYASIGYGFIIVQAATATAVIFGGLTLYCFRSKKDFSFLGGFLYAGLVGLLVVGILQLFVFVNWLNFLVAVAGVLIMSGYILFDTSQLIHKFAPDEFIVATVSLYLDIINLFLYLVQILSSLQRDS
mmetsp:Transcript_21384/g.31095  ORF Transcript_21384/g.31095 Transcript_21384/m.31095 type:complete len:255 (-) Transcript_21384:1524-2288(-)